MSRPTVMVRKADAALVDIVCQLWEESRSDEGAVQSDSGVRKTTAESIRSALSRPQMLAFVGFCDGRPAGYVVVDDCSLNPFSESSCLCIEQIYVRQDDRGVGVARALMQAVATFADLQGATEVACMVPSNVRDAHRFYARLGFTPLTVRRVASTAALRRKLAGDQVGPRHALDQVLLRRRIARLRATGGGLTAH